MDKPKVSGSSDDAGSPVAADVFRTRKIRNLTTRPKYIFMQNTFITQSSHVHPKKKKSGAHSGEETKRNKIYHTPFSISRFLGNSRTWNYFPGTGPCQSTLAVPLIPSGWQKQKVDL